MITHIIEGSLKHRGLVLFAVLLLALLGWRSLERIPLDALPDLSDVQVIVRTSYPGQAPQLVEDQVTYPLTTALMAVPGARTVRGFSFFGDSFVYVLFEDGTDLYWARSRVLEYLSQIQPRLPAEARPQLGPDASGVGWVFEYALVDRSGRHHLGELKALQDFYLKLQLQSLPGVAEVASVGGMENGFQIVVDPLKLARYNLDLSAVIDQVRSANRELGGGVLELAEAEYMIRTVGYLRSLEQFRTLPLGVRSEAGVPLTLGDVAEVRRGPLERRGIAELDGDGEVVGGIVVMRFGENALTTIEAVKERLEQLKAGLPAGVELITTYDRSQLIGRAVDTLKTKLVEEIGFVALICLLFLLHVRSTLVAAITLPLAVLGGFILMDLLRINANIMSLGGIAIAIGALVDAAIVMVENAHRRLEQFHHDQQRSPTSAEHWQLTARACSEVGPALFFSLLVIIVSFLPVFALEAQEGRLFTPLAATKTFVMVMAALLAITLVPVLIGYLVRGRIPGEDKNPLSRLLIALYRPLLRVAMDWPKTAVAALVLLALTALYPLSQLGSEFMPELEEGDLLYMPTTLPGLSPQKASELLQQTDRLIKTVPEVDRVFGKAGRADSATDPAPLTMFETTITLKPREQWRPGVELDDIIRELDERVQIPGLTNAWVQPIKTRIDMLSTGVKTPVGVRISGPDLATIEQIGGQIEGLLAGLATTRSVIAERAASGRYLDIRPDWQQVVRFGLTPSAFNEAVMYAIGGGTIATVIDGNARYPVTLRYERDWRDSPEALAQLPITTGDGGYINLGQLAEIRISSGADMIRSENALPIGWVFVDIKQGAIGDYIREADALLKAELQLPAGYSWQWAGQFEYIERLTDRLLTLVPLTIALIALLLYFTFGSVGQALLLLLCVPLALSGSLWYLWHLGFHLSAAVAVGLIALAGVAAEFGVVMQLYINHALDDARAKGELTSRSALRAAIEQGAVLRVRPKAMTVATILGGLAPIMWGAGTGNEVMQRIAAPMLGGMISAPLLSMLLLPLLTYLWQRRQLG
ncbi:MAG: efflux RND transporter permease subunit [Gammaproteobacteria bacterium]|nr:efflux RND transporter permease subunit [Gammaproteobacteria bacterium]